MSAEDFKSLTGDEKLNAIHSLLVGHGLDEEDKGLIGTVRAQGRRLRKLERFKDRGVWLLVGAGITGGWELSAIIKHFLNLK
jgi:hypothetical protein